MSEPPLPSREESIQKVKTFFARFEKWLVENDEQQFDAELMRSYTVVDASAQGKLVVEVDLSKRFSNGRGTLHGGAVGLILDMFTTAAYIPMPAFDISDEAYRIPAGFSWSMNYTCLRPLPLPSRARVECEVVYSGKRMCVLRGAILSMDRSKTYYIGEQHKVTSTEKESTRPSSKI